MYYTAATTSSSFNLFRMKIPFDISWLVEERREIIYLESYIYILFVCYKLILPLDKCREMTT